MREAIELVKTKLVELEDSYTDNDLQEADKQLLKRLMQSFMAMPTIPNYLLICDEIKRQASQYSWYSGACNETLNN